MKWALMAGVFLMGFHSVVSAQVKEEPEPPRGFYTGITTGGLYFLNPADRRVFKNAMSLGIKVGYDFFKYVSAEAQFRFSGNESSRSGSINAGIPTSFLNYQAYGVLRGLWPITRRLSVFVDAGAGLWHSDPNMKEVIGPASRFSAVGGAGLQYFLRIRGLAMGLDCSLASVRDLNGFVFQPNAYLRYTF
jgi:hypothetical protein